MDELREKIANRLWWLDGADEFDTEDEAIQSPYYTEVMKDIYGRKFDRILTLIDKAGYVRLDKNQELPAIMNELAFQQTASTPYGWYREGQRDMLKAGFRRIVLDGQD